MEVEGEQLVPSIGQVLHTTDTAGTKHHIILVYAELSGRLDSLYHQSQSGAIH